MLQIKGRTQKYVRHGIFLKQHNPYKSHASFAKGIDPIYSHTLFFGENIGLIKRTVPINRTGSSNWHQRVPLRKIEIQTKTACHDLLFSLLLVCMAITRYKLQFERVLQIFLGFSPALPGRSLVIYILRLRLRCTDHESCCM